MATVNEIVQRVKAHPGVVGAEATKLQDDAFAFAVSQLIPSALRELAERWGTQGDKRRYVMTDPTEVAVTLDADGTADLSDLETEHGILLECLHLGEIRHPAWDFPLEPVEHSGQGALENNLDSMFARYWMVGKTIHTSGDGELGGDELSFAVPHVPGLNTLDTLAVTKLVDLIVIRLRGAPVQESSPK